MKWQTIALWLTGLILIGGTVTYVDLFSGLFELTGISYTHSGDITCGEMCESYINVTTTYWRICFAGYESTKYENETLFKKRSRSRTLHVNMDNIDSIISTEPRIEVDWLVPTYGKKWRPIKDGDCWDRLKTNKIKLVGHKQDRMDTVKWGFDVGEYMSLDPIWIGQDNCTFNTRTHKIDDVKYSVIIGGPLYGNKDCKRIEEYSSLKDCKFCDNIKISIESDGTHLVDIFDYNLTSLIAEFYFNESNLGEYEYEVEDGKMKTKLKIITIKYDNETREPYEEEIEYEIEIEEGEKLEQTIPFGFNKVIKWGENSTNIILQTADTENLRDATVDQDFPDFPLGGFNSIQVQRKSTDVDRIYIMFTLKNISDISISPTITNASLNLYQIVEFLDAGESSNVTAHYVNDTSWNGQNETNFTWTNQPCGDGFDDASRCNLTEESRLLHSDGEVDIWRRWEIDSMTQRAFDHGDDNISIALKNLHEDDADTDTIRYDSKEGATPSQHPFLNVTYTVDTCTYSGSGDWNINAVDNCVITTNTDVGGNDISITGTGTATLDGANITNFNNLLIEGTDVNNKAYVYCINGGCFRT